MTNEDQTALISALQTAFETLNANDKGVTREEFAALETMLNRYAPGTLDNFCIRGEWDDYGDSVRTRTTYRQRLRDGDFLFVAMGYGEPVGGVVRFYSEENWLAGTDDKRSGRGRTREAAVRACFVD